VSIRIDGREAGGPHGLCVAAPSAWRWQLRDRQCHYVGAAESGNLQRLKDRLVVAAMERGYAVAAVVAKRACSLNEKRRVLYRL
jgi:hypothetical protein